MELDSWNYGKRDQLQPAGLQSKLSYLLEESLKSILTDLVEENLESVFSIRFPQKEDTIRSFLGKKMDIERRTLKDQQLDRFLLKQCNPVFGRSTISSVSGVTFFPKLRKIGSCNLYPKPCAEYVDLDRPKLRATHEKIISRLSEVNTKLSEMCEANLPKFKESRQQKINIFDRLVDFEKRISCSDELLEKNFRYVDELARRFEEKNRADEKLYEQIGVLVKENELLRASSVRLSNELLRTSSVLLSEKRRLKLPHVSFGRILKKISIRILIEKDADGLFSFLC